jgi:hypothetical protein
MEYLTPAVEKLLEALGPADQWRVADDLQRPTPGARLRQVTHLRKYGVRHFDVSHSVRVSYRMHQGKACVLHVGTHPEFDHFAKTYSGEVPNRVIPIEESMVMSKHRKAAEATPVANNGHVPGSYDFNALFSGLVADQVAGELAGAMKRVQGEAEVLIELTASQIGTQLTGQAQEVLRVGTELKAMQGELTAIQARLSGQQTALRQDLAGLDERLAAAQADESAFRALLRSRLDEIAARQAEDPVAPLVGLLESCTGRIAGIEVTLAQTGQVVASTQQANEALHELVGEIRSALGRNEERHHALAEANARFAERLARLEAAQAVGASRRLRSRLGGWLAGVLAALKRLVRRR